MYIYLSLYPSQCICLPTALELSKLNVKLKQYDAAIAEGSKARVVLRMTHGTDSDIVAMVPLPQLYYCYMQ